MDQTCSAPSGQAGLVVQVCFPGVRAAVLDNLNRQREEGRLCDLSIQVQGQVFRAHRCVLAASSPYFHDQVLLKNVTTVSLPSVMDPVAFESVLSSAYTGQLSILHDDIVNYVTVASFLQMWHIVDKCTEILKRPRPSAETHASGETAAVVEMQHGPSPRQQSPSSTDCLYAEREGRRRERRPDALPPLATWRRPQEFPRWGRPRPLPAPQHAADSQLDALPGCGESGEYSGCEELWLAGHTKGGPLGQDSSSSSRLHGAFPSGTEPPRPRGRFHQRGAGPSSERPPGKDRELAENEETQERKNEKRAIEADEGLGEELAQKRDGLTHAGQAGQIHTGAHQSDCAGQGLGKGNAGEMREKEEGERGTGESASNLTSFQTCITDQNMSGPSCLAPASSTRTPWQASPWPQQEAQPPSREDDVYRKDEDKKEEDDVDFGRFNDGTFSGDTYDEIEEGTGQVSQRPLVPGSPDGDDFSMGASETSWPSTGAGPGCAPMPSSSRHLSPSSGPFPPSSSSSPPTPTSSSSLSLAGTPYTGKVHFCHCGKAYTLKSMRDRHVKMQHLNLRPFGCPVCAKSFKMKHHLTKHLKTHGGLRPYECGLCGKKVIWRDSFLRHQARCERLAAGSSASADAGPPATSLDESYGYGFDEGEAFLAAGGGHVKVEEVDFHGDVDDGVRGLLASVPGIVGELGPPPPRSLNCQVLKEEASESFT